MKSKGKLFILAVIGLSFVATTAVVMADCTTDTSAKCHTGTTNSTGIFTSIITSDGFSTKCITTTNTSGGDVCNGVTNNCVYQEWERNSVFGDGAKTSKTNKFDTTASGGDCGA